MAYFSSYGPLISGANKPDVSAPGVNVVSSISTFTTSNYSPYMSKSLAGRTYTWSAMSGTSMSSPAVTGVVALVLQANPLLSTDQVRDIIISTSRNDDRTGALHARDSISQHWGWGKVDALKAVNEALRTVSIDEVEELRLPLHIYPNPTVGMTTINTGCGEPQQAVIYSIDGRIVYEDTINGSASIDTRAWNKGVYIVRVGSRNGKLIVR